MLHSLPTRHDLIHGGGCDADCYTCDDNGNEYEGFVVVGPTADSASRGVAPICRCSCDCDAVSHTQEAVVVSLEHGGEGAAERAANCGSGSDSESYCSGCVVDAASEAALGASASSCVRSGRGLVIVSGSEDVGVASASLGSGECNNCAADGASAWRERDGEECSSGGPLMAQEDSGQGAGNTLMISDTKADGDGISLCNESPIRLGEGETEGPKREVLVTARRQLCEDHPNRTVKLYCETCLKPICRDCPFSPPHRGHDIMLFSAAILKHQKSLLEASSNGRVQIVEADKALKEVEDVVLTVKQKSDNLHSLICSLMTEISAAVERRKAELFESLERETVTCLRNIEEYRKSLLQNSEALHSALEVSDTSFTSIATQNTDAYQVMEGQYYTRSNSDLRLLVQNLVQAESHLDNVLNQTVHITAGKPREQFICAVDGVQGSFEVEKLQQSLNLFGHLEGVVAPWLCTASGLGLVACTEGGEAKLFVHVRDFSGNPLSRSGVQIALLGRMIESYTVKFQKDDIYSITYLSKRGLSTRKTLPLSVMIKGVHITGSPFSIVVSPLCLWTSGSTVFTKSSRCCGWDTLALSSAGWSTGVHTLEVRLRHVHRTDPAGLIVAVVPKCVVPQNYASYPGLCASNHPNNMSSFLNGVDFSRNAPDRVRVTLDMKLKSVTMVKGDRAFAGKLPTYPDDVQWHIGVFLYYPGDSVELCAP
ncbi:hypothetical protein Pelo_111 [Pelomyxa schiedti]|nr:hypothetical protein Pelo_111 [Pelomyxa schiedti]